MSELGRDARDLIARVGRADLPSSADRARVWRSFVARSTAIGAGIVAAQHGAAGAVAKGATGAASGAAASGLGAIAKVAIIVGVGVASAGGAFLASAPPSAPSAPPVAVTPAPSLRAIPTAPAAPSIAPPSAPVAPLVTSIAEPTLALPAPRASSVPRPSAPHRASVPTDSEIPAAANVSPPSALPVPARTAPSGTADSPTAPDELRAEIDLIQRALSADASHDVVRLRALVDEHRVRFPHGAFSEERDVLRVLLLCAEGKRDEARALAGTIHLGPRSPARLRFSRSCVEPSNLP